MDQVSALRNVRLILIFTRSQSLSYWNLTTAAARKNFTGEPIDALKIIDRGDLSPAEMKGAWPAQARPAVLRRYGECRGAQGVEQNAVYQKTISLFASRLTGGAVRLTSSLQTVGVIVLPNGFSVLFRALPASVQTV